MSKAVDMADNDETWDALDAAVSDLMTRGKRREARELLQSAVRASATDSPSRAAHFASLLGSLYLADGQDKHAVDAYREATRLDPSDPQLKLSLASCLVYFLGRPAEALEPLESILGSLDHTGWAYQDARGLRGVALARLGKRAESNGVFEAIAQSAARLPASRCDLRLVEELLDSGRADAVHRAYLDDVLAKARHEGNDEVAERVQALLANWHLRAR